MSSTRSLTGGCLGNGSGSGGNLVSIQTGTVTILAGTSISSSIDCRNLGVLIGISFPAVWTVARCSFQASLDNSTFVNVMDSSANEVLVRGSGNAGLWVSLSSSGAAADSPSGMLGAPYLKVRSGSTATPINQVADRILTLIFQK